ncbi:hypersensitive-induced response protein 1 [Phtheirospermum japonicum]|uniref:Hypersensitive-induced response protein 1 n=1 Tax=Phtheirospermum japonicum TaxID=374723 RepID=A0A830D3K9_9LAMI|nr:hypersensitive-induced response protein 1 [Phtheirospermum japonicum]
MSKDVMDMVLVTHYFDTMKEIEVSSKPSAIFVSQLPRAMKDVMWLIFEGLLQEESFVPKY